MRDHAESIVQVERLIDAPPEAVFAAWFDPATAGTWLFATPDGVMEKVEISPGIGGGFVIAERRGEQVAEHVGTWIALDRPHRIVFDFTADGGASSTRVTVAIAAEGEGSHVVLSHVLPAKWADFAERSAAGWRMILDGLAASLR